MKLETFAATATPSVEARAAALRAVVDTIGVALAGAIEPAAEIVRRVITDSGPCVVLGTDRRASATNAALANGTAAHALDYDDMCFVSLAHPSAPLVTSAWAAAEAAKASGRALLEAYVVGFEIEGRLGRAMNPRHYRRGWHCTSTLGTIGSAAACARLCGLDEARTLHALAIAASSASGLKENFGTMVKPLHAGLAARSAVLAVELARAGMTASAAAIDGPQGFLAAFDSESPSLDAVVGDLGARWEILDTGITVKLYPSCAATHPMLDALIDLQAREHFTADDVERIDVGVDPVTPTVLIYDRPSSGLEGKFSLPFCAAAAVVNRSVGIETFDDSQLRDPRIASLQPRVTMRVDETLDSSAPPLTQARVSVTLKNGKRLVADANGARGYPERPATDDQLKTKFKSCATRVMSSVQASEALTALRSLDTVSVSDVSAALARVRASTP
ncbi:MAG TPA: MmgE/PrpD family protein [Vicinamibacterales bacterium]|nr:MmgE/PrpD family protein [Vicinamibacterales bacterium]